MTSNFHSYYFYFKVSFVLKIVLKHHNTRCRDRGVVFDPTSQDCGVNRLYVINLSVLSATYAIGYESVEILSAR